MFVPLPHPFAQVRDTIVVRCDLGVRMPWRTRCEPRVNRACIGLCHTVHRAIQPRTSQPTLLWLGRRNARRPPPVNSGFIQGMPAHDAQLSRLMHRAPVFG